MPKAQGQLFETTTSGEDESTFVLQSLEVFNWGPFAGLHRADFDPRGTAIIGPTGSGKTTLVDALMTLLVSQPKYNLASTGGHESDRTLISYVRGVLGGDGSDGREEVARSGKTITGVCATYSDGDESLKLAGLLWTDGNSNAAADLKRRWLFSEADDQGLPTWLNLLNEEGIRELMRTGRETANLRIFDSKKAYLAHIRKFFDVGDNAFSLLNRAAGLKQLNSIDEIFRELVLDDRAAFDRALQVAAEFDNLAGIHSELEIARKQQQSLLPVAQEHGKLLKSRGKEKQLLAIKRIVPVWFAIKGAGRWAQTRSQIEREQHGLEDSLKTIVDEQQKMESQVDLLREQYLQLGGNVIAELENTIASQNQHVQLCRRNAGDYQRITKLLEVKDDLSESALLENQATLRQRSEEIKEQREEKHNQTLDAVSLKRESESHATEVQSSLEKVKQRPGSNIPPKFQDFRTDLAEQLAIGESELPFLAELIEVQPNESEWRGAIERAIGSERLRILVPHHKIEDALRWINHRDNRLHVRLQRAMPDRDATFFGDGFVRKLNFKEHSLQNTAKQLLSKRDLHCVDSAKALRDTEHALTVEGTISGHRGRFEKQDQRRLRDGWMTGFDNKDQLESLAKELQSIQVLLKQHDTAAKSLTIELRAIDEKLKLIEQVLALQFSTIDLPAAELKLATSKERLARLLDPKSDASRAKADFDLANGELASVQSKIGEVNRKLAVLSDRHDRASEQQQRAEKRIGDGLSQDEIALSEKHISVPDDASVDDLADLERHIADALERKHGNQLERVAEHERRLIRFMENALKVDTGALVETGSELDDVPDYLERLKTLTEEALPEKLSRFLEYLNRSSDQGVTQLLAAITEEVDAIEQRIADLNHTLAKVDFRKGRYLQLQPQKINHERVRTLHASMRKLRSAALKDDAGESHYKALRELVEILRDAGQSPRKQGSRALLDPRYRLEFYVVEVDRETGNRSPPRTGSQSGSGGEKELMASHILTASLSYALCPTEATRPLYGTVILDEAFSKSSPSAATRIIEALRIFHLHPVFVTPNKEIGLLKKHTRKVICVQRPGKQASLASISWEKLEEMGRNKMARPK